MISYFGNCNCKYNIANFTSITWPYHGYTGNTTSIKYLRVDREVIGYLDPRLEIYRSGWQGYRQVNRYTGFADVDESSFGFLNPNLWPGGGAYTIQIISDTERLILNFEQTVNKPEGGQEFAYVNMREVLSVPNDIHANQEQMRTDAVESVPWDNPFIYDLEHRILVHWRYNADGSLILNDNHDPNPVVMDGCGANLIISYPDPTEEFLTAMRRKERTEVKNIFGGSKSSVFLNCGTILGDRIEGDPFTVEAQDIILPPSREQVLESGYTIGHTQLVIC